MVYTVCMKILIVTNLFPPMVLGGYEILCHQVVHSLQALGHSVTVLTSDEGGYASNASVVRTLKVFQSFDKKVDSSMRAAKLRCSRHNREATKALLASQSFDVIFLWSMLRLTPSSAQVAEASGIPVVYTFNDEHPSGYLPAPFSLNPRAVIRWALDATFFRSLTNRSLQFASTTCISKLLKDNLLKAGLPIQQSEVIYQGIPIEQFPKRAVKTLSDEPIRLLYAGQLHAYKGVHTLLEALALLNECGRWSCTIVGSGTESYEKELAEQASHLALPVKFLGRVAHNQMSSVYQSCDVLVFPSIWPEPFGLTHLEAMASGLVVVSTVNGGQGEFLTEGENALTFPPSDAKALATQLERLAQEEGLYDRLVASGRKTVEEGFTFGRYVSDLVTLLEKAITRRR